MRAIILAAGRGSRLRDISTEPKCLLEIAGRPLVRRYLDALRACGVEDIVLVAGYREGSIREALATMPVASVRVISNPAYRQGSILSLWAARDHIDGDILLMDADVFFDPRLLLPLTQSTHDAALLVDEQHATTGEEFLALLESDRIARLGRALVPGPGQQSAEWVGFTLLRDPASRQLREALERILRTRGPATAYEDVVADLAEQIPLRAVQTGGLSWTEIDFPEDVERAVALAAQMT